MLVIGSSGTGGGVDHPDNRAPMGVDGADVDRRETLGRRPLLLDVQCHLEARQDVVDHLKDGPGPGLVSDTLCPAAHILGT